LRSSSKGSKHTGGKPSAPNKWLHKIYTEIEGRFCARAPIFAARHNDRSGARVRLRILGGGSREAWRLFARKCDTTASVVLSLIKRGVGTGGKAIRRYAISGG
jgi:hypothetical protein